MANTPNQPTPEQLAELEEKIKKMSPEELKEFQKSQCIFCQIIAGKVPAKKIYEDNSTIAVLDINPANPGHALIMPKEHYVIMPQISDEELGHLFNVVRNISQAALRTLEADGTNIIIANGAVAGQRAQHFMVHAIPRKEGDGIIFTVPQKQQSEEELEAIWEKMAAKLGAKKESKNEKAATLHEKPAVFQEKPAEEKKEQPKVPEHKKKKPKEGGKTAQQDKQTPKDEIPENKSPVKKGDEEINIDDIANLFK